MNKIIKVPLSHFERFKKEVLKQIERLGFKDWKIEFKFKDLTQDRLNAQIAWNYKNRNVCFLYTNKTDETLIGGQPPEVCAKHEVGHLLIAEIQFLGECRFLTDSEMDIAVEKLAVILSKVL